MVLLEIMTLLHKFTTNNASGIAPALGRKQNTVEEKHMDFATLIYVLAAIVTIGGGIAAVSRYLQTRRRKAARPARPRRVESRHYLNLNLAGQHQQALESCREALRQNPQDDDAYVNLSWALNALGRHQEALDASDEASKLNESAPAYTNRGWALQALKHYSQALRAHEKALALDPNFAPAYKGKGDDLLGLGQLEQALAAYGHALLLDPGFAPAYRGKGDVLQQLGRFQEAQQAYEKARQFER